jgi:hypothetical protein
MRIRNVIAVVGITGTLIVGQLVGNAFAATTTDSLTQAEGLLATYQQTNNQVAACMRDRGLTYYADLMKDDVWDAYSIIPSGEMNDAARKQLALRTRTAATENPNDALLASMSSEAQATWAATVNDCSTQIDSAASGGAEGRARVEAAQRAALASPEVQAASRTYVGCMSAKGFTVDLDPFVAPQNVSEGEHGTSDAEITLVDQYNAAWSVCAQSWQQTFDQKLFG